MKLYFDLDEGKLVQGSTAGASTSPLTTLEMKRRDGAPVEIVFMRGATVITNLAAGTEIHFIAKQNFGGDTLIHGSTFAYNSSLTAWAGAISTNTTELNDLFTADNEPDSELLKCEVSFREDPADLWTSSQTIALTIHNDLYTGSEGSPVNAADPNDYRTYTAQDALTPRNDQAAGFDSAEEAQLRENIGLNLTEQTLTDAATVAWDMDDGYNAKVTLGGARTLGAPTNAPFIGAEGFLTVIQDGTGARTLALNAAWIVSEGVLILDPTAAAVSRFRWRYDGTNYILWRVSGPHIQTLTDAASIDWNLQFGLDAKVTLGGNRMLADPLNPPPAGTKGTLTIIQDATGGRTLTFGSAYAPAPSSSGIINGTISATTRYQWTYDGSEYQLNLISAPFIQTLTDGATIAWDMSLGIHGKVTLGGNRTLGNPTNKPRAGASGTLVVTQDGTGSRTLAFDTDWDAVNGAITLNATASDVTLLSWFYDGSKLRIVKP